MICPSLLDLPSMLHSSYSFGPTIDHTNLQQCRSVCADVKLTAAKSLVYFKVLTDPR
jgi:hypothetical protein